MLQRAWQGAGKISPVEISNYNLKKVNFTVNL
jgi:hypothetical protein